MMTNEDMFEAWAPADSRWSSWAKPVLFAQGVGVRVQTTSPAPDSRDYSWLPRASGQTGVVVDLGGVETVRIGLKLAELGHRPVPLYNTSDDPAAVLDVRPLRAELTAGAETLRRRSLPPDAPPAFLLDAARMRPAVLPSPGTFDNRWMVFPQDFPSGTFLKSAGITDVLLIHDGGNPQEDLAHVLLRWQQAGIRLQSMTPEDTAPRPLVVHPPSWFRKVWYRAITVARLRRNNAGGFGAAIPVATSGGYG